MFLCKVSQGGCQLHISKNKGAILVAKPRNDLTPLRSWGVSHSTTAFIFSLVGAVPYGVIHYPRNSTSPTIMQHLLAFKNKRCLFKAPKISLGVQRVSRLCESIPRCSLETLGGNHQGNRRGHHSSYA